MPTSYFNQLNDIVELIVLTNPNSILDVGAGFGKYGFLAREYLDADKGRFQTGDWMVRIEGIEIHKKYLSPVHSFVYDKMHLGDAVEVIESLSCKFDLILLIDVIEHFENEKAEKLLMRCEELSENIIVSTPHSIGEQGEMWGNPHEAHKSQWRRQHFSHFRKRFFVSNDLSLICYIGTDSGRIKKARQIIKLKLKIRKWMPLYSFLSRLRRKLLKN